MGSWHSETVSTIVKKFVDNLSITSLFCGILAFGIFILVSTFVTALAMFFICASFIRLIEKFYKQAVLGFEKAKNMVEKIEAHDRKTFSDGISRLKSMRQNWDCKPVQFRVKGMIFKGYETNPNNTSFYRKVEGPFCETCADIRPNINYLFLFPFAFRYKCVCGHSSHFLKETPYTIFSEAKKRWFTGTAEIIAG
jgi:hypothetical protein